MTIQGNISSKSIVVDLIQQQVDAIRGTDINSFIKRMICTIEQLHQ